MNHSFKEDRHLGGKWWAEGQFKTELSNFLCANCSLVVVHPTNAPPCNETTKPFCEKT